MSVLKKSISIWMVFVLVLSVTPLNAFASDYLSREQAAEILVESARNYNSGVTKEQILTGVLSNDSDNYISRIDFLVMLTRAFDVLPEMSAFQQTKAPVKAAYTDIPIWASTRINKLISRGILTGSGDGLLNPYENITNDEIYTILRRVWNLYGNNPKDDLFSYVVETKYGGSLNSYVETAYSNTYENVMEIISDICFEGNVTNKKEQKIFDYFNASLDFEGRNSRGIEPIREYISAINSSNSHEELENAIIKIQNELAQSTLFTFTVGSKLDESGTKAYYFSVYPASFTIDELENDYEGCKKAFTEFVYVLFKAAGQSAKIAQSNAEILFEQESDLARHSLDIESSGDPQKINNVLSFDELADKIAVFDMNRIFESNGCNTEKTLYVYDTGLTDYFVSTYCDGEHLEDLKRMALASLMASNSDVLTTDLWTAQIRFENYIEGNSDYNAYDDKFLMYAEAFDDIELIMEEYIEEIYCSKYYSDTTTAEIKAIVDEIIATYESNIANCTWMSDETKTKAIDKLKNISYKIGHPSSFETEMDNITINGAGVTDAAFKNDLNINLAFRNKIIAEIDEPVNKDEWIMKCYETNAVYLPNSNSIYIPAGILVEPIYCKDDSREEIMAKIGYIIAHEISHAFDLSGSQYDASGNLSNWWTDEDRAAFEKLSKKISQYYDGYEAFNGIATKGSLTMNENFADICGMSCVLSILGKEKNPDYSKFFESYAAVLFSSAGRSYEEYNNAVDVHARGRARVNLVVSCFNEFYDTYSVEKGDGMYVSEEDRIKIW